jgi:hypothetical protein
MLVIAQGESFLETSLTLVDFHFRVTFFFRLNWWFLLELCDSLPLQLALPLECLKHDHQLELFRALSLHVSDSPFNQLLVGQYLDLAKLLHDFKCLVTHLFVACWPENV